MKQIKPPPKIRIRPGRPRALDDTTVAEARDLAKNYLNPHGKPYSAAELARLYGVTPPTMKKILEGAHPYG